MWRTILLDSRGGQGGEDQRLALGSGYGRNEERKGCGCPEEDKGGFCELTVRELSAYSEFS